MDKAESVTLRPVILGTLVVCVVIAAAPWFSGGQESIAMLLGGGALLLGSLLAWRQPQVRNLRWGKLTVSFAALIAVALLSFIWTANRYSTGVWVTQWLLAGLAFRLVFVIAGEPKGRDWLTRAYLGSAAFFSAAAIWVYLTTSYDRLTGAFYWPNPAAAYLMPAILISVDKLRTATGRIVYFWGAAVALFISSFLLADSRAALLVLIIILATYLLVVATRRRYWIHLVFALLLGIVLSFGLIATSTLVVQHSSKVLPGSRLADAAGGSSQSLSDRIYYLRSAVMDWVAHPLGGSGAGTFGDVHPQYQLRVVSAGASTHNLYVQTLAELGLVGAITLVCILVLLFAGVLRGLIEKPELLAVALGAVALLIHFGLDIDASYPALLVLAAVLLAIVYRPRVEEYKAARWRWPVVAALLLVPIVSLYESQSWAARAQAAQTNGDYPGAAALYASAHRGLLYNPDYVNAEGIDLYTDALGHGPGANVAATLALERAHQAERLDPHDAQHHQLEGRVLELQGKLVPAEVAFREALKLDPYNHPDYALDLASAQVKMGDQTGAIRTAQAMLGQYPASVAANRSSDASVAPALGNLEALVGNIRLKQGDLAAAQAASVLAIQYDSSNLDGRALAHQVALRIQAGRQ